MDSKSFSFIVRVWLEEPPGKDGTAPWRGRIIHVQKKESIYFQSLLSMVFFILPYILEIRGRVDPVLRFLYWIRSRFSRRRPASRQP